MPLRRLLVGVREGEDTRLVEAAAVELKTHRQTVGREAARQ
jgi:hypothetical protein